MKRSLLVGAILALGLGLPVLAQQTGGGGAGGGLATIPLGQGLSNARGSQNSSPLATGQTLYQQVWTFGYSADHTVLSSEVGGLLLISGSSPVTITLPAANSAGFEQGQGVCTENDGTGTTTLASASTITGPTKIGQFGLLCAISDGAVANTWHISGLGGAVAPATSLGPELGISSNILGLTTNGVVLGKLATQAPGTVLNNATGSTAGPTATAAPVLGVAGTPGTLTLNGLTSGGVTLKAADATTSYTFKYPDTAGGSGQVLTTNGAGVTSWTTAGGSGTVTSIGVGAGLTSSATCVSGTTTAITGTGTLCIDAAYVAGHFGGLTLSNDGGSPNTKLDVTAGAATSDDNAVLMKATAFNFTTSAWVLGTNNGCLDTGSVANNTWYYAFLIERPDTGVVDKLCSTSISPSFTLPGAAYTKKRLIGAFKTDGSANILPFKQNGSTVYWTTATLDVNAATIGTTAALQTLNVPPAVQVYPLCRWSISNATGAGFLLTSPVEESDVAPTIGLAFSAAPGWDKDVFGVGAGEASGNCPQLITDTSGRIRARASAASTSLSIVTRGWSWVDRGNSAGSSNSFITSQTFSSPGTFTWTKPPGATLVYVELIGAGGGGGGGAEQQASNACSGGGGGGSSPVRKGWFLASALGSTETINVGTGGAAGIAATGTSTAGGAGGVGGNSSFGSWVTSYGAGGGGGGGLAAGAGGGGAGGLLSAGASGTTTLGTSGTMNALTYSALTIDGGYPGANGANGAAGGSATATLIYGGAPGGAGGGISAANAMFSGGAGGSNFVSGAVASAGGTTGVAGTAGISLAANFSLSGGSGGGGGGSHATTAGAGGAGGFPGGGAGGGGCVQNGGTPALGGRGADGEVIVRAF